MRYRSLERFASSVQRTRVVLRARKAHAVRPASCGARIGADEDEWTFDDEGFDEGNLRGDELADLILESAAIISDPNKSAEFLDWLRDLEDDPHD